MKYFIAISKIQHTKTILFMLFIMIICIAPTLAQDGFDDPGTGDVPVDGGLSLLVAAGVGYGMRKVRNSKQREKSNS